MTKFRSLTTGRCALRKMLSRLLLLLTFMSLHLVAAEDGAQMLEEPQNHAGAAAADGAAAAAGQADINQAAADAAEQPALAKDVFDLLDSNHDGRMDRTEFQRAVDEFEEFLRHHPKAMTPPWYSGWWPAWLTPKSHTTMVNGVKKDLSFWGGFTSAVGLIVATEIGDKTFFIAAVLSMKQDRGAVFGGAILALILMTVLSTLMGLILPQFLDRRYTHLLAGVLFGYFGLRLLYESRSMASHKVSEELEEVEEELLRQKNKKGEDNSERGTDDSNTEEDTSFRDVEMARKRSNGTSAANQQNNNQFSAPKRHRKKKQQGHRHHSKRPFHVLLLQSFTLTFVAEWGDRSQIATIALAAAKNPYGVTVGGCLGHSLCTGLAVLGGRMLAARISEKTVSQWGGVLFLIFGIHSLFFEN